MSVTSKPAGGRAGSVSLVGAGPGDPDLLTRAALKRLRRADLLLYDALVSPQVVALALRAQRFCVGKRAGRPSVRQETINKLMIRGARRGQYVVRLKCGDPFVLGRGGEEALALRAAGIPVEVVPGVTSAVAGPALAGIPVTHRGISSAFLVLSAHAEASYGPVIEGLAPSSVTIVALMGLASAEALSSKLIARGWPPATPAAVLFASSTPAASTWKGTLGDLSRCHEHAPDGAPGTIVIGEVVDLASALGHVVDAGHRRVGTGS